MQPCSICLISITQIEWTTEDESLGVAEGAIGAVFVTHESENPRNEKTD